MYKCPNCGSNIKPMEKFCGKCGTALQVVQNNINENNQIIQNDNISDNEFELFFCLYRSSSFISE